MRIKTSTLFLSFASVLMLLVFLGASLSVGPSDVGPQEVLNWLTGESLSSESHYVLEGLRLPRTIVLCTVGACLALAGLLLQILLDNPLAEPYTLGLSGGATLGTFVIVFVGVGLEWVPFGAILGCLATTALLLFLLLKKTSFHSRVIILIGVMISLFCGSLTSLLMSLMNPTNLGQTLQWMMGQAGTSRDVLWPGALVTLLLTTVWASIRHRAIDALLLGEDLAISAGHNIRRIRVELILIVTLLTAAASALMGLIGFVGLLAPHLARLLQRSRRISASLLPTLCFGAVLVLAADVLGRTLGGTREIPAGGIVALIGAPILIGLLLKRDSNV